MFNNEAWKVFQALGDEHRFHILAMLMEREMNAGEILDTMDIVQSTLSHHMKILVSAELVSARREGKCTYYVINPAKFVEAQHYLDVFLSADAPAAAVSALPLQRGSAGRAAGRPASQRTAGRKAAAEKTAASKPAVRKQAVRKAAVPEQTAEAPTAAVQASEQAAERAASRIAAETLRAEEKVSEKDEALRKLSVTDAPVKEKKKKDKKNDKDKDKDKDKKKDKKKKNGKK